MSGQGVGRHVSLWETSRPNFRGTKVQLSGYYGRRTAGSEESYSFSGTLIWFLSAALPEHPFLFKTLVESRDVCNLCFSTTLSLPSSQPLYSHSSVSTGATSTRCLLKYIYIAPFNLATHKSIFLHPLTKNSPLPPPRLKYNLQCYLPQPLSLHPAFHYPCSPAAPESPSGSMHLSFRMEAFSGSRWRCPCIRGFTRRRPCVKKWEHVFGVCTAM